MKPHPIADVSKRPPTPPPPTYEDLVAALRECADALAYADRTSSSSPYHAEEHARSLLARLES